MKKLWMLAMLGGAGVALLHGEDASRTLTINLDYDARVPQTIVYRATGQASGIFGKIGTQVQFRSHRSRPGEKPSGLALDLYIGMEAPADLASETLGLSHPFRSDGRIEVFYSRIQEYKPVECRVVLLAYILAHEITHVLEGMVHHSATGVMKEKWEREDFRKIQAAKLGFDPADLDLIREGMEKRLELRRLAR